MTFTEAAAEVLRLAGKPMHYKEITELAIEQNLLSHVGKSPEVTMGARLAALLKKEDKANPIMRVKPGVFALREWSEKKKKGKDKDVEAAEPGPDHETDDAGTDVNALEVEAAARESHPEAASSQRDLRDLPRERERERERERDEPRGASVSTRDEDDDTTTDRPTALTGEDALRADLAASGAELFDDEEDDDQPILAPAGSASGPSAGGAPQAAGEQGEGGRRRRRRRRRGRGGAQGEIFADRASSTRLDGGQIQPTPIVNVEADSSIDVARDLLAPAPRPLIRDRQQIMAGGSPTGIDVPVGEGEELAGRDLADAATVILNSFDRNAGPVPFRSLVDSLMRRGRLGGDPAAASIQLSASLRADNLRRTANSQRPRFRFSNGSRVALTDWALGGDLIRLEQELLASLERYRDASRRVLLRRLQELPGHAFIELALLALDRAGMANIRAVRRAGSPGGEAHFCATHRTGADEIRTAIVVRKDGREIGRERVTDLRGALHHYGPATAGWLITAGQVLSGAREEASAPTAAPIALYDGLALCKLLEENDVGVLRTRFPVGEFLETLRG